jgi:GalNAc5-diNAcBac-PP-undecaprenol beta-1,3-glucosyltransferase
MRGTRPTVSAVITAYDRPDFLETAIKSALAQTYPVLEVIVIDDCSPTDLAPVVADFDGVVQYERLKANSGANVARNRGISLAAGDLVAFLDDDDIWMPEKLEQQIAKMGSDAEACLCGFGFIGESKERLQPIHTVTQDILRQGNQICGTSGLIARRLALLEELFDEDLPNAQDWDMYVRLVRRKPIPYIPAAIFERRYGSHDSITLAQANETPLELARRASAIEKHRAWLGEKHYQRLIASNLLKYISSRKYKGAFLLLAVRRAGFTATLRVLYRKLFKLQYRLKL